MFNAVVAQQQSTGLLNQVSGGQHSHGPPKQNECVMKKSVVLKSQKDRTKFADKNEILSLNINEYFDSVIDHFGVIANNYNHLNEYYSNNVPANVENDFKVYPYVDYVLENLNTHDSDLLISSDLLTSSDLFNSSDLFSSSDLVISFSISSLFFWISSDF